MKADEAIVIEIHRNWQTSIEHASGSAQQYFVQAHPKQ
jgi:hypothetical protein